MLAESASGSSTNDRSDGHDASFVAAAERPPATAAGADPPFTRLERLVIGMGERDALTGAARGRWGRLRDRLVGTARPRPLADARLEALRILVIALHGHPAPAAAIAAALGAGLTRHQIEFLRSSSSRPR